MLGVLLNKHMEYGIVFNEHMEKKATQHPGVGVQVKVGANGRGKCRSTRKGEIPKQPKNPQ
jgi:hypothetical protein